MKKLLFVSAVMLLMACAGSVSVISNVDPNNKKLFSRILINKINGQKSEDIFSAIETNLDAIFLGGGLIVKNYNKDSLIGDNGDLKEAETEFKPEGILSLREKRNYLVNGSFNKLVIFGSFFDVPLNKTIWKADMEITPAQILEKEDIDATGRNIAVSLVRKMTEDNLIKKLIPDSTQLIP